MNLFCLFETNFMVSFFIRDFVCAHRRRCHRLLVGCVAKTANSHKLKLRAIILQLKNFVGQLRLPKRSTNETHSNCHGNLGNSNSWHSLLFGFYIQVVCFYVVNYFYLIFQNFLVPLFLFSPSILLYFVKSFQK